MRESCHARAGFVYADRPASADGEIYIAQTFHRGRFYLWHQTPPQYDLAEPVKSSFSTYSAHHTWRLSVHRWSW